MITVDHNLTTFKTKNILWSHLSDLPLTGWTSDTIRTLNSPETSNYFVNLKNMNIQRNLYLFGILNLDIPLIKGGWYYRWMHVLQHILLITPIKYNTYKVHGRWWTGHSTNTVSCFLKLDWYNQVCKIKIFRKSFNHWNSG